MAVQLQELQRLVIEHKESLKHYRQYLIAKKESYSGQIISNIKDRELDLYMKGKVAELNSLIEEIS